MRKNGKYVLLGILALLSVFCVAGIAAYFIGGDTRHNMFTAGFNDVEITEEFPDPEPSPGEEIKKVVQFANTGDVPCYVRARLVFSNDQAEDISFLDLNREQWAEEEDGYFYYQKILPVKEQTEPLMTAVRVSEDAQIGELEDWDLYVYVETAQSDGYDTPQDAFAHLQK